MSYPPSKTAPIHTLVGFSRVHIAAGATQRVRFALDARAWSEVLADGTRAIVPGRYTLFVGGSQPGANAGGVSTEVTIEGNKVLPQ